MTEHTHLAVILRDRFLEAAQKKLIAFERREREFVKKEKQERAEELRLLLTQGRATRVDRREAHRG